MKYTGVIHMHSTHSYDGKVSLRELKDLLKKKGVSFACMTEHTDTLTQDTAHAFVKECEELSDASFVFIPGFEVPYRDAHILMVGSTEFVAPFAKDIETLRQWKEKASFVSLAHPVRNHFILDEGMREVIDGVEIWNQQYDGKLVPRTRAVRLLEKLRKNIPGLFATGGLDFHRTEHFGAPQTHMDLESLTRESILAALKKGYFSFGADTISISARGELREVTSIGNRVTSAVSVFVIVSGKTVNKILKGLGISLPKSLKEKIRSKI